MIVSKHWIFTAQCQDRPGLVSAITTRLFEDGFFIEEASQFGDPESNRFFMRLQLRNDSEASASTFEASFEEVATKYDIDWTLTDSEYRPKILLMVSKFEHCLSDLLYRYRTGELKAEIVGIVSNHPDLEHLAERAGLPFHHIPISKETKPEAEAALDSIIKDTGAELIILARYMQILSSEMCARYPGQIINIHHSFLPGFKGAKPYHRAHDRGVKLIGATAHYATPDLDEGPIIEQLVERVDHSRSKGDLIAIGRDVEALTLAKAVKLHLAKRVFLNGVRTVVFD